MGHIWSDATFSPLTARGINKEADNIAKRASRRKPRALVSSKKGSSGHQPRPPPLCISEEQGRELLADVHGGDCGHHSSSRTLAGKVFHCGFYWPTALSDAAEVVQSCEACQFHAKQIHQPVQGLQTIPLSWPFVWAEVEPVHTIPAGSTVKIIKGLVSRFGISNRIITDNGSQFTSGFFRSYCANPGSQICYAFVAQPRSNSQAEHANAKALKGLKTRSFKKKLEACGKGWLDELPSMLWSMSTTLTKSTGKTPFFLVYGAEAILPSELKHGSPRVLAFDEARRDDSWEADLVLLKEACRQAALRAARYQQALRRYHRRNIRPRTLEVGDLILRWILSREGLHKLSPVWEGPFRVAQVSRPVATRLEMEDVVPVQNTWNIQHLCKLGCTRPGASWCAAPWPRGISHPRPSGSPMLRVGEAVESRPCPRPIGSPMLPSSGTIKQRSCPRPSGSPMLHASGTIDEGA
nr:uncharacterized protein LOC109777599 [Aegilops tauschii subsp. strangulata]